jgi:iron complex outermembrane receptor protein
MRQLTLSTGMSFVPVATYHNYPSAPIVAPDLVNGGGFNTTVDGTGLRLAQTPRFQGNVQARYDDEFAIGKVSSDITVFHSSGFAYELSNFIYQNSYTLLNASVSWSPHSLPYAKVSLWGKNITNTRWIGNYLSNGTAFDVVYQAPREIGLTLGYSF